MKKALSLILALVLVLGTMPVLALFSNAKQVKTNIAFGKATETGTGGSGASAVDNNTGTYVDIQWTTDGGATLNPDCWVTVDLGEVEDIIGIGVANYQSSSRYYYFDVYGSTDNATWTLLCQKTTNEPGNATYTYDVTASVRYVKVVGTYDSANAGYHFAEIQVFQMVDYTPITYTLSDTVTAVFDGDTLTVSGTGAMPDYSTYTDRPYQAIAGEIKHIVIESGITQIGKQDFCHLSSPLSLKIAEGVTAIKGDAFAYSGTITDVYLPVSLTSMSQGVFYSTNVTNVYYDDTSRDFGNRCTMGGYNDAITNANWVNDPDWGSSGYMDEAETILWAFDAETGTLSITGTGAIPQVATKPWQSYVSQITKVVIGEGITSIPGGGLFSNISTLDRVEMPDTVTSIGGDAFAYAGTISYLRLSANVTSISQGVLYGSNVTTISCKKDWRAIQQQASIGAYNDSFGTATWVDVEIYGSFLSFGKYGNGMENWSDDTQVLICPKWDGVWDADFKEACLNQEWTLTFESEITQPVTSHLYVGTCYDGGNWAILRFMPATASEPSERFVPYPGVEYTITATMTYNGVTNTVTSADKFFLESSLTPVTYDTWYTVTWQIDGVTEYTENVPEGKTPVYHGEAASHQEGNLAYVVNMPATAAIFSDTTYNITYTVTDMTAGTLGLWGSGYENWTGGTGGNQTQLLLRPKDWQGNDLTQFDGTAAMQAVDWILTINGVEYTVKPTTHYAAWIFRFEPALWENGLCLVPGTYSIGLVIKDAEGTVVFYTTENTTITVAEDFEPTHKFVDVVTEPTATAKGYTTHTCANCGKVVVDTYTVLPGYYFVGDVNNWALEPAYALAQFTDETANYVIKGVELGANAEYKVVYTADGVAMTTWYPEGDNCSVGDAGTYNVYLVNGNVVTALARNYNFAGNPNGWTHEAMTETGNTGVFVIDPVAFAAGEGFKITDGSWDWAIPENNWIVNTAGVYTVTYDEKTGEISVTEHVHTAGAVVEVTTKATFTEEGTKICTCTECGENFEVAIPAAQLGIYGEAITGETAEGKKTVGVVGTITGEDFDTECVDKLVLTLIFKQNGETVKTKTVNVNGIYKTVNGVASSNESTATSQGTAYVEASYIYALVIKGIPEGDYTIDASVVAVLGTETVATYTADPIAFTIE